MSNVKVTKVLKFNPSVATHYRNVVLTQVRKITEVRDSVGLYNGLEDAEVRESFDIATQALEILLCTLNKKSSKKIEITD